MTASVTISTMATTAAMELTTIVNIMQFAFESDGRDKDGSCFDILP